MEFQYHLPVNLLFGRGKSDAVGEKAAALGKRALIVTGGSSAKRSGLLAKVEGLLREKGVSSVLFDKVKPNPLTTTVYDGAALAAAEGCDLVIAVGGGSSIDAAKGIAFQTVNGGDINDFIFGRKVSTAALPLIALPTTCGTGSEGNGFAVMTNPQTLDKKSLRCNAIVPACSIIDPLLMTTMPQSTLACVGFDALCHNMEAYLSALAQPLTTIQALEGIRLCAQSLCQVYEDPSDLEGWERLTLASTLGGMVINSAGVAAPHSLEHPASGLKDIVHGKGLAALTPLIFEQSIGGAPEKFALISKLLGGRDEKDCAETIRELLSKLDLTTTLGEQGISEADVDWLAENCLKISAAGLSNHPLVFGLEEIKRIYREAI
ncbi:iron-containing alcohol dehydrogenase [Desulfosporosinus sp. PR]|uniref:iron-containing alcohol dehydrogenase n=1 Tax=Candidatus Desulfosporosinus nitrosoreducens TaxID=3401928 RepID=UPI0027FD436B|nr:iron-containing alcohol dehydrogenase [Desulfosporosinus sp. PR]MDQ7096566.1 iron-containing alcohol dehydrogenase [Desulfosporosinus sp. PR]